MVGLTALTNVIVLAKLTVKLAVKLLVTLLTGVMTKNVVDTNIFISLKEWYSTIPSYFLI